MDFKEFINKSKLKLDELVKEIDREYELFWQNFLDDLERKKLTMESEIETLDKTEIDKKAKILKLSDDILRLNNGIKDMEANFVKYKTRQDEMLSKIIMLEKRENAISLKEKLCEEKEIALNAKKNAIMVEQKLLDDRQNRINRYLNK